MMKVEIAPQALRIESDDMVEFIRSGGTYYLNPRTICIDYLVFDDEGHSFSKKPIA